MTRYMQSPAVEASKASSNQEGNKQRRARAFVCIPAFNEEKTIGNVVRKSLKYVDKVIVCDDGSSDNTGTEARMAGAVVIRHEKNEGKGSAMKTLFKHARKEDADIVVTIDGDGQFLPEEMEKLIIPILEDRADIVTGDRFDSASEMPAYRMLGNKALDKITSLASDLNVRDTQSGFRGYAKIALDLADNVSDGFGADSEILINAARKGLRIAEVPVTVLYDTGYSTSKKDPVSHVSEVFKAIIETVALRRPLRYIGIPGFIFVIIGIIYSVIIITTFNETRYFSVPFTLIALGSLVVGLILLLMSVVLYSLSKMGKYKT